MREDDRSNKAPFRNLKLCPSEKKNKRDHGFILIKSKHTVNQDKKNLRYNFLKTSKLIINPFPITLEMGCLPSSLQGQQMVVLPRSS